MDWLTEERMIIYQGSRMAISCNDEAVSFLGFIMLVRVNLLS